MASRAGPAWNVIQTAAKNVFDTTSRSRACARPFPSPLGSASGPAIQQVGVVRHVVVRIPVFRVVIPPIDSVAADHHNFVRWMCGAAYLKV
ncbi:hypothetical protein GE061_011321 [Apolygus lucorum]|uniref:Uncharacterized protein n=1 Tax=Apolygus lucorum TaxID=248454 RepID=A0A8S9XX26_APOLU|nr:hypothetical protein GE061_011321 [Apolygus lucorum]